MRRGIVVRVGNSKPRSPNASKTYLWTRLHFEGRDVWVAFSDAVMTDGIERAEANPEDQPQPSWWERLIGWFKREG